MNNYDMIATLVRIDNNGEKEIDMRQVASYWDALQLLADYAMDHAEDDEYVAEKYAMFMSDEDRHGADKTVGWLEKNGKISETFVEGKYSIELRVYESEYSESTIRGSGRVDFDDDLVAVYTPDGKLEYKGLFDDCPYKNEPMQYDRKDMVYRFEAENGDYRTMVKLG